MKVVKRDGKIVDFDPERIRVAIKKSNQEVLKIFKMKSKTN